MVEAAGIEPASDTHEQKEPTSVASAFKYSPSVSPRSWIDGPLSRRNLAPGIRDFPGASLNFDTRYELLRHTAQGRAA